MPVLLLILLKNVLILFDNAAGLSLSELNDDEEDCDGKCECDDEEVVNEVDAMCFWDCVCFLFFDEGNVARRPFELTRLLLLLRTRGSS